MAALEYKIPAQLLINKKGTKGQLVLTAGGMQFTCPEQGLPARTMDWADAKWVTGSEVFKKFLFVKKEVPYCIFYHPVLSDEIKLYFDYEK